MHDPREPDFLALKRILRFLQCTLDHGLYICLSHVDRLVSYSDADWDDCLETCVSISGFCVYLGDNLVPWSTKCQHVMYRSSTEVEYKGVDNVVVESVWLHYLLLEL